MERDLVSIIIAVYNAQKYIGFCLDSLVNQSYNNIEIVLVDDGSTDDSYTICKKYTQCDDRIVLLQKENGGSASARNLGLERAKGEYIIFVDADDVVNCDYIEKLHDAIQESDIAICGFDRFVKDGEFYEEKKLEQSGYLSRADVYEHTFVSNIITGGAWNKLLKACILQNNSLCFDRHIFKSEDTLLMARYYQYCDSFFYVPECLYHYRNNPESKTQEVYKSKMYNHKKDTMIDVGEEIVRINQNASEEIRKLCEYRLLRGCIWVLFQWIVAETYDDVYAQKMKGYAKQYGKSYIKNKWSPFFQKIVVRAISISVKSVYKIGVIVNHIVPSILVKNIK